MQQQKRREDEKDGPSFIASSAKYTLMCDREMGGGERAGQGCHF